VYVSTSSIPHAGRGIFARKPLKRGTVVSFLNGIKIDFLESKVKGKDRDSQYSIDNDWTVPGQSINIPPNYRFLTVLVNVLCLCVCVCGCVCVGVGVYVCMCVCVWSGCVQ
jgi:hypothetical protein